VVLQQQASTLRPGFPVWLTLLPEDKDLSVYRALRRLLEEVVVLEELLEGIELGKKLQILLVFGVLGLFAAAGVIEVPGAQ